MVMNSWWVISNEAFLDALQRCHAGENPDMVLMEIYANSDTETVE